MAWWLLRDRWTTSPASATAWSNGTSPAVESAAAVLARIAREVPLPSPFFAVLAVPVGAYLVAVEVVKRWFYRRVSAPFVPDQR